MRFILFWILVIAQAVLTQASRAENAPIRVMTFNIRYGTAPDGDNSWVHRKEFVLDILNEERPDILGLQEALRDQFDLILEKFPRLSSIGASRETDGGGEYTPLLYDRTRFDLLEAKTVWLSDEPGTRGSRSWGNNLARVYTVAKLVDRTNNRVLSVYNTHWDHESQESRLKSGEFMAREIKSGLEPVIVMGDFNAPTPDPSRQLFADIGLRDSLADFDPKQANEGTFHAFTGTSDSGKIDAILVSRDWQVDAAQILKISREGKFPSDHYPVTATLTLKSSE